MSLILDALQRSRVSARGSSRHPSQADAVLATLGYSPKRGRGNGSVRGLVYVGLAALLAAVVLWSRPDLFQAAPADRQIVTRVAVPARPTQARAASPQQPRPVPIVPRTANPIATPGPAPQTLPAVRTSHVSPAAPVSQAPPQAPVSQASSAALVHRAPIETSRPRPASVSPVGPAAAALSAPPAAVPAVAALREPPRELPRESSRAPSLSRAPSPAPSRELSSGGDFSLALYYHRAGEFEKALTQYRAVLERNELNAEAHNNVGLLYQERGLLDEAVTEFQRATYINPRYGRAHSNLGVALMRQGKLDLAIAEFSVALAIDPRDADALVNLALAQKSGGLDEDARTSLLRALAIDPRNAAAHYNLALLYDQSGEAVRAVEHYRDFLDHAGVEHAALAPTVRTRVEALSVRLK